MATTTSRLGLTKPATTDLVDITVLNDNFDKTDAAAGAYVCTSATRPGTPYSGQIIYETDTKRSYVWDSGTSSWLVLVPGSIVCTSSSRPSSPVAGQVIYETDTKRTYVRNGSAWAAVVSDLALTQFSPVIVASAAARDALIPSPTQGQRVFRTDLQVEETYFAAYNASTNVAGAKTANWYPAPSQALFFGTASRTAATGTAYSVGASGFAFTELVDPYAWHDASTNPDRVTPNREGLYRVSCYLALSGSGAGGQTKYINKNGGVYMVFGGANSNYGAPAHASNLVYMNGSTDYLTFTVTQDSGGNMTATAYVSVEYVRPSSV